MIRGGVARPRTIADPDQPNAVRAWEALLDAGLIGPETHPSASSSVIASRDAADALFRRIAADRRRAGRRTMRDSVNLVSTSPPPRRR